GQDQQRDRAAKSGERDGGQLPVPVLRGMDKKGDVASKRSCRDRLLPRNHAGGNRKPEQRHKQHEPDRPYLCQGLEIEAVRVENRQLRRPRTQPPALETSSAGAEPRMVLVIPPGDAPVLG